MTETILDEHLLNVFDFFSLVHVPSANMEECLASFWELWCRPSLFLITFTLNFLFKFVENERNS